MMWLIHKLLGAGAIVLGSILGIGAAAVLLGTDTDAPNVGGWFMAGLSLVSLLVGFQWVNYAGSRDSWRNDPATDRQKEFADELGIRYPRKITKGELSDMISEVTGR